MRITTGNHNARSRTLGVAALATMPSAQYATTIQMARGNRGGRAVLACERTMPMKAIKSTAEMAAMARAAAFLQ